MLHCLTDGALRHVMQHRSLGKTAVFSNGAEKFKRAELQGDLFALGSLILRYPDRNWINAR
jgi:hypothetical protein